MDSDVFIPCQLLFETFPSIVLQIRMLIVENSGGDNIGVSIESIYLSIGFAIIDTLMKV